MPIAVATIFIAILVVGMHLPNLQRISERKENKFSLSALRKKTGKESKKDEEKSENDN